jgi:hypothetical protein
MLGPSSLISRRTISRLERVLKLSLRKEALFETGAADLVQGRGKMEALSINRAGLEHA